ncbi:MAG: hypothetical protein MUC59_14015 [Saprospiraceae bacterium]|jgi:hypothetical protein|nr:hypothetical protein [Saprospiraceae bacterium]
MCHVCEEYTIKLPTVICDSGLELIEVTDSSPKGHRNAVEQFATYFRREMHFGFVQYSANEPSGGRYEPFIPTVAYLFTHTGFLHYNKSGKSTLKAFGACCFRERERADGSKGWELDWVWVHPYKRRQGILGRHWDCFQRRFGAFTLCPPISEGMQRFMEKLGVLKE